MSETALEVKIIPGIPPDRRQRIEDEFEGKGLDVAGGGRIRRWVGVRCNAVFRKTGYSFTHCDSDTPPSQGRVCLTCHRKQY